MNSIKLECNKNNYYKNQNKIPVTFICNNNYVMQVSVVITSLIKNKYKNTIYDIYIFVDSLSTKSKQILNSLSDESIYINIIELGNKYKSLCNNTRWPNLIFFKFDIPFILKQYDKIIFLDADTIVLKDLTELYNINLKDSYAGVVNDIAQVLKNTQFDFLDNYFNIGFIMFNAKKIRQDFSVKQLINCYKKNINTFVSPEQDTFNYIFNNNIKCLSYKWQYITLYNKFLNIFLKEFYKENIKKEDICILHYASLYPWKHKNIGFDKVWIEYYKLSPYKDVILQRTYYNIFIMLYRFIRYNYKYIKYRRKINGHI